MGFIEAKMINSDFLNEPINYLSYIDSIETYGSDSYVFDPNSKRILHDVISNSQLLFNHAKTCDVLVNTLTTDDIKVFMKNNKHVGTCLNHLFHTTLFSAGDFNSICEYMNMSTIHVLPDKWLKAFGECVTDVITASDGLTWIKSRYQVDLTEYKSLDAAILNTDAWKIMIKSKTLMSTVCTSTWFTNKVIESEKIQIWVTTDGLTYYDNNGVQYNKTTNQPTGTTIETSTLELMKTSGLVTEDVLINNDSAYKRVQEALRYLAQNESITIISSSVELIKIFLADEDSCQFLADNPESALKNVLKNTEFAKQLFSSDLAFEKIGASDAATKVLVQFISDIQTSYDTLSELKESLNSIPTNSEKIYNVDALMNQVQSALDDVNRAMAAIVECQNYTTLNESNITAFMHDSKSIAKMFANIIFTKWAAGSTSFTKEMVKNEDIANYLSSDSRAYNIALSNATFINALFADPSLYESQWISDEDKRNIVRNNSNAMNLLGKNEEMTRRFINKHMAYDDSLYPTLSGAFSNATWTAGVCGDEFLMGFINNNQACSDLLVDSETGMNAVYAGTYASMFDTEMNYKSLSNHGDVGFYKWFISKAGTGDYKSKKSFTEYCKQLKSASIVLTDFKNAIDKSRDLMIKVFGSSKSLIKIYFSISNLTSRPNYVWRTNKSTGNYNYDDVAGGQLGLVKNDEYGNYIHFSSPVKILDVFESIKVNLKENSIFVGCMLYYFTRVNYYSGGYVNLGADRNSHTFIKTGYNTLHDDLSEYDTNDMSCFNAWSKIEYYKSEIYTEMNTLKWYMYNSDIFMTKYIMFLMSKDINLKTSMEDICSDDDLFNEFVRSDDASDMAYASEPFIDIIGNSKKNLDAMYKNCTQVEKNLCKTANNNASLETLRRSAARFRASSICTHKTWHVSDVNDNLNVFTSSDFVTIEEKRCLLISITVAGNGTISYGHFPNSPQEASITGKTAGTTVDICRFVKYLKIKAPTGDVKAIDYIVIDD